MAGRRPNKNRRGQKQHNHSPTKSSTAATSTSNLPTSQTTVLGENTTPNHTNKEEEGTKERSANEVFFGEDKRPGNLRRDALKNESFVTTASISSTLGVGTEVLSNHNESQRTVDARSLVLLINNSWRLQRSEWLLWVMNHMFRPLASTETKDASSCFEVIELTDKALPFWADIDLNNGTSHGEALTEHYPDDHLTNIRDGLANDRTNNFQYRMVPQTQIYTLYKKYCVVFLLDVSSSLTTIDPYSKNVLVEEVIGSFKKCLVGISEPFSIPSSYKKRQFQFQPQIHLSVLADCTQTLLHPAPIRILLHNLILTPQNRNATMDHLRNKLRQLQREMTEGHRATLARSLSPSAIPAKVYLDPERCQSHFLEAGILTLKLLPQDGSPVVVLLSDGVAEFGQADLGTGLRAMAKDGVLLTVIQIGSSFGFTPACNLGYVPDNEALRFLAMATGGKFLYAADCPFIISNSQLKQHQLPNFYHRLLLIQEAKFQRPRHDNRHSTVNIGQERICDLPSQRLLNIQPHHSTGDGHHINQTSGFPWSLNSPSPSAEYLLTRYRDYALPLETSCILNARLREGFFIERIILSGSRQNRAEKIHINLAMTWLPNVVIQYRIRAQLPSDYKIPQSHLNRSKYIRIEMNILASTGFAVSFVNVDSSSQPLPTNSTSPLLANVLSLHQFLKSIFATDDTLKSLTTILQQFPMLKAPRDRANITNSTTMVLGPNQAQKLDAEAVKALWASFESSRLDYISNGLFDYHSTILALSWMIDGDKLDRPAFQPDDITQYFIEELGYSYISSTTYIKYLHAQKLGQHNFPSFCVLRIAPISAYLMWTRLVFINVRYSARELLSRQHANISAELIYHNGAGDCKPDLEVEKPLIKFRMRSCKRPLHNLLVEFRLNNNSEMSNPSRRPDLPTSAKDYLTRDSQVWLDPSSFDQFFVTHKLPTIYQLVFSLLIKAKLAQGFVPICQPSKARVLFYKEFLPRVCANDGSLGVDQIGFGMQYQLDMTPSYDQVLSTVWIEPTTGEEFQDRSQVTIRQVLGRDELVVANLVSFDRIHAACRHRTNIFDQPVRLRSLVLNSVALISNYMLPTLLINNCTLSNQDIERELLLLRNNYLHPSPNHHGLELMMNQLEFQDLSPIVAHYLLLQYYFESSLMAVCDGAVAGKPNDPCDSFFSKLSSDLHNSAYPTNASLKWGFAKSLTPTSFALIFVPSVADMLRAYLNHNLNSKVGGEEDVDDEYPLTLQLWTYECIREDLDNQFQKSFTLSESELTKLSDGPWYSNRYPFISSSPELLGVVGEHPERIEFWTEWSRSQPNVSPNLHQMQTLFDELYARSFVQSVYSAMLRNLTVEPNHVRSALGLCRVITLSLSLTDYLNLKTEKKRRNLDGDSRIKAERKLQRKFHMLVGYHFGAVPGWEGTYYFKSPQKPNIQFREYESLHSKCHDVEPEEPVKLGHLLDQAAHPMFMQLQFSFTQPTLSTHSQFTMVTDQLPTSYPIATANRLDYSPGAIGTEHSPLDSNDGTHAIIKLCLYLPPTQGQVSGKEPIDQAKLQSLIKTEDELLKHPDAELLLHKLHLKALTETRSRLEWLIKEEVIDGLLTWRPITTIVLRYIDRKLSVRNPFVDFPSSFSMSLKFVDKVKGKDLFTKELGNIFIHPYCIVRSEEYFYVQPIRSSATGQYGNVSPFLLPKSSDNPLYDGGLGISVNETLDDEPPVPNFWMLLVPTEEQVQISFFSKSVAGVERSRIIQRIRRKIAQLLRRVNQIILLDELDLTRICSKYLLPPDQTPSTSNATTTITSSCNDSNNINNSNSNEDYHQVLSYDNHSSNSSSNNNSDSELIDNNNANNNTNNSLAKALSISDFSDGFQLQVGPSKFKLGQFQCPLQFKEIFPLHWRLKPMMALNHILTSVMHPLSVANRHNLFVIRDDTGSVFYLKLREIRHIQTSMSEPMIDEDTKVADSINLPETHPDYELQTQSNVTLITNSDIKAGSPSLKKGSNPILPNTMRYNNSPFSNSNNNANSSVSTQDTRGLILEVYGIQTPNRDITNELVNLIDTRLVNHLTLGIISSYLARNATLKLTPADVQFIFPLKQHPTPMARAQYTCPSFILNPVLLLLYAKQNMLHYLHILGGSEARQQYKSFCQQFYHHQFPTNQTTDNSTGSPSHCDCFVGDFVFFYNCISSRSPTSMEQILGQGTGLVCLTLADVNSGKLLFQQSEKNLQHLGIKPLLSPAALPIRELVSGEIQQLGNKNPVKYQIRIDVWSLGSVNSELLLNQVILSLKQSVVDYMVDCTIKSFLVEAPTVIGSSSGGVEVSQVHKRLSRAHSESDKGGTTAESTHNPANLGIMDPISPLTTNSSNTKQQQLIIDYHLIQPATQIIDFGYNELMNPSMFSYSHQWEGTLANQKLLLSQLYDWLADYHQQLAPNILEWSSSIEELLELPTSNYSGWIKLSAPIRSCDLLSDPTKFLMVSGIPELKVPVMLANTNHNNTSSFSNSAAGSTNNNNNTRLSLPWFIGPEFTPTRRSSSEDMASIKSKGGNSTTHHHLHHHQSIPPSSSSLRKDKPIDDLLIHQSLNHNHQCHKLMGARLELTRHHLLLIQLTPNRVQLVGNNLNKQFTDHLNQFINRLLSWQNHRSELLKLILHQKMGLFHIKFNHHALPLTRNPLALPQRLGILIKYPNLTRLRSYNSSTILNELPNSNKSHNKNINLHHSDDPNSIDDSHSVIEVPNPNQPSPLQASSTLIDLDRTLARMGPEGITNYDLVKPIMMDPLQIHGMEFLDGYNKLITMNQQQKPNNDVEYQLNSLLSNNNNSSSGLMNEIHSFLTAKGNFLHFCRTPLFQFKPHSDPTLQFDMQQAEFKLWYHDVIIKFFVEYGGYIEQELVGTPLIDLSLEGLVYKLHCVSQLLIVTLNVVGMMVHLDIYHLPSIHPQSTTPLTFYTQLGQLKQKLHLNSFTYDFQLVHLQRWLEGQLDHIPKLNLINLFQCLLNNNNNNRFARNQLKVGWVPPKLHHPILPRDLYQYIIKMPTRYGMRNIYHDNRPIGFYIMESCQFKRIIVLTLANDQLDHHIAFHYHSIKINYHKDDNVTDCINNELEVIDHQLGMVLRLYHRDNLWKKVQEETNQQPLTQTQVEQLQVEFSHLDLLQLEPAFAEFATQFHLNWGDLLNSLILAHPQLCRATLPIAHDDGDASLSRHVIFFNPYDSHHLIYFGYQPNHPDPAQQLMISAVARDPRPKLKVVECEQVTSIIRSILYLLWQTLHAPFPP